MNFRQKTNVVLFLIGSAMLMSICMLGIGFYSLSLYMSPSEHVLAVVFCAVFALVYAGLAVFIIRDINRNDRDKGDEG